MAFILTKTFSIKIVIIILLRFGSSYFSEHLFEILTILKLDITQI